MRSLLTCYLSPTPRREDFFLSIPMTNKLLALCGFLLFALSPSFIDYQQSPELRWQFAVFYFVAIVLVWQGVDGWIKEG